MAPLANNLSVHSGADTRLHVQPLGFAPSAEHAHQRSGIYRWVDRIGRYQVFRYTYRLQSKSRH
jgi:hypothetical protein